MLSTWYFVSAAEYPSTQPSASRTDSAYPPLHTPSFPEDLPMPKTLTRLLLAAILLAPAFVRADEKPILKKGDHVVIIGDSITEQKLYSRYLETYVVACQAQLDLSCLQLGWSGETAGGFLGRMDTDLFWFKPNVITTCYGMNDGGYRAYEKGIGDNYRKNMQTIIQKAKQAGVFVVVGSPGAVDSKFFRGGGEPAAIYNDNLAHLRDIAKKLAQENDMAFADVHGAMDKVMPEAKKALGDNYPIGGGDGVHPAPNGQLIMAYAFLKGLRVDGQIGTINVDLADQTTASAGHKVLAAKDGSIELESTRYPYCFSGDDKSPNSPRSILPFLPFQQELNRFTLVVKNAKSDRLKVTWGKESKTFSRDELEKGVNLAAEFRETPFATAFQKVDNAVGAKQNFETQMIKGAHVIFRDLRSRRQGRRRGGRSRKGAGRQAACQAAEAGGRGSRCANAGQARAED